MHIIRLEIENLPPLGDVEFDCDERVNLFIGPNGSGKSTILQSIHEMYFLSEDHFDPTDVALRTRGGQTLPYNEHLEFDNPDGQLAVLNLEASDNWRRCLNLTKWRLVPLRYIPAVRVNLRERQLLGILDGQSEIIRTRVSSVHFGIFCGQDVEAFIDSAREGLETRDAQFQFRKALDIGYSCAKEICREIIHDDRHHWMSVGTTDNYLGEPLYAGKLSSGTQGTLMWVWALALKMADHYDWEEDWQEKPAILLIDEIENHLHPTWQRRVIPALLKHFPGLQIFATTHSPFVVAGLKAGQVHLLKRDYENGAVTASTNTEDIIGWTADEILRTMLGVDDPTDERTANAAQELRQLRQEGYRSDPEAEEERQERMRELRKLVDRDLLAGGPWKRQREIFEEQFAESLRKYRESQSLNQENG